MFLSLTTSMIALMFLLTSFIDLAKGQVETAFFTLIGFISFFLFTLLIVMKRKAMLSKETLKK